MADLETIGGAGGLAGAIMFLQQYFGGKSVKAVPDIVSSIKEAIESVGDDFESQVKKLAESISEANNDTKKVLELVQSSLGKQANTMEKVTSLLEDLIVLQKEQQKDLLWLKMREEMEKGK